MRGSYISTMFLCCSFIHRTYSEAVYGKGQVEYGKRQVDFQPNAPWIASILHLQKKIIILGQMRVKMGFSFFHEGVNKA